MGLAGHPGLAIYKVGMTWPLETEGLRAFAEGRRVLLVVEEKRSFVEAQIRSALYNLPADSRPAVVGKTGLDDAPLLPAVMELSPELVAAALARVLPGFGIAAAAPDLPATPERPDGLLARAPTFCAGCPHATSTRLPEGAFAMAGIGCHVMAMQSTPGTGLFSVMGGEGVAWTGLAPFTSLPHMFANMGDGTYQHSGLLAIRQSVAAGTRITYKILYNDAVAMTGGQPAEGGPTVIDIARQVWAENVARIYIVADDPARLPDAAELPPGILRHGRDALPQVQAECAAFEGVSVIIYDQVCATEKRRRRKRGTMAAAELKVSINPRVCENCGDCTTQSHCIAIEPIDTEYGRKRRISPTSCNTDLSCLKGFCPSFVTSATDAPKRDDAAAWQAREAELAAGLPDPVLPDLATPWRGLFAGIGGGGIVTAGAVVAMAASLEGKQVSTLDFTGLAQKNGAVVSHVQIAHERAGRGAHPDRRGRPDARGRPGRGRAEGRAGADAPRRRGAGQPRPAGQHRLPARPRPGDRRRAAPPRDRPRGRRQRQRLPARHGTARAAVRPVAGAQHADDGAGLAGRADPGRARRRCCGRSS